jgi:acetyltransferase-like isoleucine patch superfamily enzyme
MHEIPARSTTSTLHGAAGPERNSAVAARRSPSLAVCPCSTGRAARGTLRGTNLVGARRPLRAFRKTRLVKVPVMGCQPEQRQPALRSRSGRLGRRCGGSWFLGGQAVKWRASLGACSGAEAGRASINLVRNEQRLRTRTPESRAFAERVQLVSQGCFFLDFGGINIGDGVLIGPQVTLSTAGHPVEPDERYDFITYAPVVIEEDVWIGAAATITPGVTVGRGSVVGAGAVVAKDVPPPAWSRERVLVQDRSPST